MMTDGTSLDTIVQTSKLLFIRVFHQCIAVIFIYSIWIAVENYSTPFSWHVILSTLGIIPFMIEALILFSNDNLWSREISRKQKYWIHGILMFIGSALIIIGIALEYARRAQYEDVPHFISAHSKTGLAAMILVIIALICGLMTYYASAFSKWIPPVWLKLVHNIVGQLAFISSVVCLFLAYFTDWFIYYTSETSRITATVVTVLIMFWSLFCAWKSILNQIKSILH